ncbi:MAG: hypothetical protein ACE5FO_13890 [Parvularculaceae bacterium]
MGFHARFFAAAAIVSAAGCATDADVRSLREEPSFQVGYGDGCSTALEEGKSFSTKRLRDEYLFDNDRAYRSGWRQGYLECGDKIPEQTTGGRILGEGDDF